MTLGQTLVSEGRLAPEAADAAVELQRAEGTRFGEVLVAHGLCPPRDVWRALTHQWELRPRSLSRHWVDTELATRLAPQIALARRVLPLRARGGVLVVAMSDPTDTSTRRLLSTVYGGRHVLALAVAPDELRRRTVEVYADLLAEESSEGLRYRDSDASAWHTLTDPQRKVFIGLGVLSLIGIVVLRGAFFIMLAGLVIILYGAVVAFRAVITYRGGREGGELRATPEELAALTDLPAYTILCPLYREAGVLPQLVDAITKLDYPRSLLDVKLLLEADDVDTIEAVRQYPLPPYVDVLIVPAEGQRTKPKACNYGLQFARGEYTVIYDAEDIPDPDQLRRAVHAFRVSPPDIACAQARLNYYNSRQNVLTSWFTLEYTAWFDFFLPGLVKGHLPVPLGGSSNHFPTALLRELGGWDPYNVTEDADLGMRLHRRGMRTLMIDSTTWEEANSDFVNWMRQRSRWGKGYAISWLVQMRHPRQLLREVGWKGFLAMLLTLAGTYAISLLNLVCWLLTALWFLAKFDFIAYLFPGAIYYVGMLEMVIGNFLFVYMGVWAAAHRRYYFLSRVAVVVPVYWLMIALAMIKATLQLFTQPTFWEKTVHGLVATRAEVPFQLPTREPDAVPAEPLAPWGAPAVAAGAGVPQWVVTALAEMSVEALGVETPATAAQAVRTADVPEVDVPGAPLPRRADVELAGQAVPIPEVTEIDVVGSPAPPPVVVPEWVAALAQPARVLEGAEPASVLAEAAIDTTVPVPVPVAVVLQISREVAALSEPAQPVGAADDVEVAEAATSPRRLEVIVNPQPVPALSAAWAPRPALRVAAPLEAADAARTPSWLMDRLRFANGIAAPSSGGSEDTAPRTA